MTVQPSAEYQEITVRLRQAVLSQRGSVRSGPFGSQLLQEEFVEEGVAAIGTRDVQVNRFGLKALHMRRRWGSTAPTISWRPAIEWSLFKRSDDGTEAKAGFWSGGRQPSKIDGQLKRSARLESSSGFWMCAFKRSMLAGRLLVGQFSA